MALLNLTCDWICQVHYWVWYLTGWETEPPLHLRNKFQVLRGLFWVCFFSVGPLRTLRGRSAWDRGLVLHLPGDFMAWVDPILVWFWLSKGVQWPGFLDHRGAIDSMSEWISYGALWVWKWRGVVQEASLRRREREVLCERDGAWMIGRRECTEVEQPVPKIILHI